MDPSFLDTMEHVRRNFGFPIIVSSGYRSPEHNKQVSKTGDSGPHTTGRAMDIAIRGEAAYVLLKTVLACGMTGIGINQRGDARFLHIDNLEKPDFPRPMIWSY